MPNGGLRMVEDGLKAYGYEPDPFVDARLRHLPQDPQRRCVRRLHRRDARRPQGRHHHRPARRLRPRPDHRRLPARRAVRHRPAHRGQARRTRAAGRASRRPRRHPRPRGTRRADPRAGRADGRWPPRYGYDISRPAATAREAIQWLYFAYLAAAKEQNGAAMSLGRTSTFLDVYLQRDLDEGTLDETARPGADRRLRDQAADRPVPAHPRVRRAVLRRPDLGDRVASAASARDGRPLVTRTCFRYLQTLYNLGPAPEPNLTVLWSPRLPDGLQAVLRPGVHRHQRRSSTRTTT